MEARKKEKIRGLYRGYGTNSVFHEDKRSDSTLRMLSTFSEKKNRILVGFQFGRFSHQLYIANR